MSLSNLSSSNSNGAFLDYGEFRSGVYIQTSNQILYFTDENGNKVGYQWKGLLPHTTTTNDPNTDGGISDTAWCSIVGSGFIEKLSKEGIDLSWKAHLPTVEVSYNLPHKSLKIWEEGTISTDNDYWLYPGDGTVWNGVGVLGSIPDVPFKQIVPQNNVIEWNTIATEGQNQFTVPYEFTNISVFINGLLQNKSTGGYVVNGSTVTLNGSLKAGDVIHVVISNVPTTNIIYALQSDLNQFYTKNDLNSTTGSNCIGLLQGGTVQNAISYITLEMFSGLNDDDAFTQAVALARTLNMPIYLGWKTYNFSTPKVFDAFDINIIGCGIGKTIINLNHFGQGLRFGQEANITNRYKISLKGFSIIRTNYQSYTGSAGPKNLYVSNRDFVSISDIEVYGNIGYGIQTDYSENVLIENCYVHDAFGGGYTAQKAGTDGIHLYRTKKAIVRGCKTFNLGDDGFSTGSFLTSYPCSDIIFENNIVEQCAGGFKAYSLVNGVKYTNNTVRTCLQGAFYLTNDNNAIDGSYVLNIQITNNQVFDSWDSQTLTNIEGGVLRIRMWPDNATTNATATINNVYLENNHCQGSAVLVSHVVTDNNKRLGNLYIKNNNFKSPKMVNSSSRQAIRIIQCDYELCIENNIFSDLHSGAIYLDPTYGSFTSTGSVQPVRNINNNHIRNYNRGISLTGTTSHSRAISILQTGYDVVVNMYGNTIQGCTINDTVTPSQSIFVNGNISPLSLIESNTSDLSQNIAGTSGAYKGNIKYVLSAPSSGTHYKNSNLQTQDPTTSTLNDYICYQSGTYGTLNSVTASGTGRTITVNDSSQLYVGCVISIVGTSGIYTVSSITDNTVILTTSLSSTVSNAAVSFSAPLWRRLSWSTSTPTTSSI